MWLAVLLSLASFAHAQSVGGSLGAATDDLFRGLSENDGQISPQADLHVLLGPWYGGASAQEVRRGVQKSTGAEVIVYAGSQLRFDEDWTGRVTLRHYDYPGSSLRTQYD